MNKIYLSACDAQAGMIFIYPVDPVKKMEILILLNYSFCIGGIGYQLKAGQFVGWAVPTLL